MYPSDGLAMDTCFSSSSPRMRILYRYHAKRKEDGPDLLSKTVPTGESGSPAQPVGLPSVVLETLEGWLKDESCCISLLRLGWLLVRLVKG